MHTVSNAPEPTSGAAVATVVAPRGAAPAARVEAPVAPGRLAVIRLAVTLGAFAVVSVEVLSAFDALTRPWAMLLWGAAAVAVAGLLAARWRLSHLGVPARWRQSHPGGAPARWWRRVRQVWSGYSTGERWVLGALAGLLLGELVLAALAEPNNFDSQTYHLPRIEHWVVNRDVGAFATDIHRQVTVPPGSEYLLLHLRLLTGGDSFYNLVQYAAGLVCVIAATRIVRQLGGGRSAQLIAAVLVATTPMVVVQSTSTQTDLVVAAWVAAVATFVLDAVGRRLRPADVLAIGAAIGLVAVTKPTGLLAAGPLLLILGIAQLRRSQTPARRRLLTTGLAGLGVLLVALAVTGPFLARMLREFGSPLGAPVLSDTVSLGRHDPGTIVVNALRISITALDTPFAPVREGLAGLTNALGSAVGVAPDDPAVTYVGTTFPVPAWYPDEDRVSFPLIGLLGVVATAVALRRPRRLSPSPALLRGYALVPVTGFLLYVSTLKWQPWGNRLLLFLVVLVGPVVALWLDTLRRPDAAAAGQRRRPVGSALVAGVLVLALIIGWLSVGYGFPRRLVGDGSVLTTSPIETRFIRRLPWLPDYAWAAAKVRVAGAHRVGVIEAHNDWEYPWWLFLPGVELVALRSVVPRHPPAPASSTQAIVCTTAERVCRGLIPPQWTYERHGFVSVGLPPR